MEEDQKKMERQAEARKELQQWTEERNRSMGDIIAQNNEEAQIRENAAKERNNNNEWQRVLDNCEMDPAVYAGDSDVSRMRAVMQSRKADIDKK